MHGYLAHHGVKGQKWGIRRYQNPDGSLTAAGRERYYKDRVKQLKAEYYSKTDSSKRSKEGLEKYIRKNYGETYFKDRDAVDELKTKRVAIGLLSAGAAVGAVAAGAVCTVGALDALGTMSINAASIRNDQSDFADRVDNIINDKEQMVKLEADKKMYRILYGTENDREKIINESLYTTDNEADRALYKNILGNMQGGSQWFPPSKKEITYKLNNDVYTAQGKVLFDFALEAVGSDKTVDDLDIDKIKEYHKNVSGLFGNLYARTNKAPEGFEDYAKAEQAIFALPQKDKSGKLTNDSSIKLRNKLIEEGFGAVKDYTDAGILGQTPRILLNASNDVSIDSIKDVTGFDEFKAKMILGLKNKGK